MTLVAMVGVCAVGAAGTPASANWTTNGDATGMAWTTSTQIVGMSFIPASGASVSGVCTSSLPGRLFGPSLATGIGIANATLTFTSCSVGGSAAAYSCDPGRLDGLAYTAPNVQTTLVNVVCRVTKAGCGNSTTVTGGITISGSAPLTFRNATTPNFAAPNLGSGQTFTTTWTAGCLTGTAPGTFEFHIPSGAANYNVTSSFKPQITN
jgi:hypothetical protein